MIKQAQVEFIRKDGSIFCIARDGGTALHHWKGVQNGELDVKIRINGRFYDGWQARHEIENLFGVMYAIHPANR